MSGPEHVALVGCGFTGTSAFYQLVENFPVREITIFEASGEFGPGYPYRPAECPDYLLNNTADSLCLDPTNRRAFLAWLESKPELEHLTAPKGHLPRALFGRFLTEVVEATRVVAAIKGIKVRLIPAEATGLSETANGGVVLRWSGGEIEADAAILTTGRCPAVEQPAPPAGGARYIADHVMSDGFDDLPLDAEVHVLGASLSAYDVINRLFSPSTGCRFERGDDGLLTFLPGSNQRRVALCSRSGRLKRVQSQHPMRLARRRFQQAALQAGPEITLGGLAEAIKAEAADHGVAVDWDAVADPYAGCRTAAEVDARADMILEAAIRDATDPAARNFLVDLFGDAQQEIWDLWAERPLSLAEETIYRARLESALLTAAAPCPAETAERLLALRRAGRLRIVKGVRAPRLAADGRCYEVTHDFGVERATVLVNAAGAVDRDVRSADQPALIRSLVEGGLLRADRRDGAALPGAAVHMRTFRAVGARSVYLANMLLWGPGFFTSSAFMMASVVKKLLSGLYAKASRE